MSKSDCFKRSWFGSITQSRFAVYFKNAPKETFVAQKTLEVAVASTVLDFKED